MSSTVFPAKPIRVLLLENVSVTAHEVFAADGFSVEALPKSIPAAELKAKLEGVHILGIRSKTQLTADILAAGQQLLTVGCFCIGTNQVALAASQPARRSSSSTRPSATRAAWPS